MTETSTRPRPGQNLDYPFTERPETGSSIEVVPGVHWVRMRLPFQLNHINLWLLEDGDGWTVVDTGVRDEPTAEAWRQLFDRVMAGRPVKRVIVTHLHPDHVGMAGWLVRRFGCMLWMSRTDYLLCRNLCFDTGLEAPEEGIRFYKAAGFPPDALEQYRTRFGGFGKGVYHLPNSYHRISDGEEIRIGKYTWQVVVGRGHSPEHACLWCRSAGVFISGDQILPRISSNVSLFPTEPDANPLQDWLDSCAKLERLVPDDELILPSHNEPFRGARQRLRELIEGHEANLSALHALCREPKRAVDCFPALFRSRITAGNFGMATGESLAHLSCLIARGQMRRDADAQGVDWYISQK
ncbi:MAG: MBL fold metallo-hydrolase [Alphaproteobacteria bacterium]|nr:MBL fold metallo-hydrolase [Alphaproteobacteria bacterium]